VPEGMGIICAQPVHRVTKPEIKRDFEYLNPACGKRNSCATHDPEVKAPTWYTEEGSLIKRSLRRL